MKFPICKHKQLYRTTMKEIETPAFGKSTINFFCPVMAISVVSKSFSRLSNTQYTKKNGANCRLKFPQLYIVLLLFYLVLFQLIEQEA